MVFVTHSLGEGFLQQILEYPRCLFSSKFDLYCSLQYLFLIAKFFICFAQVIVPGSLAVGVTKSSAFLSSQYPVRNLFWLPDSLQRPTMQPKLQALVLCSVVVFVLADVSSYT